MPFKYLYEEDGCATVCAPWEQVVDIFELSPVDPLKNAIHFRWMFLNRNRKRKSNAFNYSMMSTSCDLAADALSLMFAEAACRGSRMVFVGVNREPTWKWVNEIILPRQSVSIKYSTISFAQLGDWCKYQIHFVIYRADSDEYKNET